MNEHVLPFPNFPKKGEPWNQSAKITGKIAFFVLTMGNTSNLFNVNVNPTLLDFLKNPTPSPSPKGRGCAPLLWRGAGVRLI